jgi:hypothetical protein
MHEQMTEHGAFIDHHLHNYLLQLPITVLRLTLSTLLFQRKLKKISWILLTICIGGSGRTVKG